LLADVPDVLNANPCDRIAGFFQGLYGLTLRRIGLTVQFHVSEKPILAVVIGCRERLTGNWAQTTSKLARALRQKLLQPGAEIGDSGRGNDCDLVTSEACGRDTNRYTKLHPGIFSRRYVGPA